MSEARILVVTDPAKLVVRQNRLHTEPKWWACPTTLSKGAQRLVGGDDNGLAHYGVWCLLAGYMATRKYRWTLTDSEGNPVPLEELAWLWRVPVELLNQAVERLTSKQVNWLAWQEPASCLAVRLRNTDETDGRDERYERNDGGWQQAAVGLGLSSATVLSFGSLITQGVPAGRVEVALKDGQERRASIRNVESWARGVRRELVKECL